jgi:hypothetical protein
MDPRDDGGHLPARASRDQLQDVRHEKLTGSLAVADDLTTTPVANAGTLLLETFTVDVALTVNWQRHGMGISRLDRNRSWQYRRADALHHRRRVLARWRVR